MTPKCPNHNVPMDRTDTKRMWICPISGAVFEADSDENEETSQEEMVIDRNGQLSSKKKVTLTQTDGGSGG